MIKRRLLYAVGLAVVAALPLVSMGGGAVAAEPTTYTLKAGGGETGYAVNEFLIPSITVLTGDIVNWQFTWNEPHTVTFGEPTGDPTAIPDPFPTEPVAYDGTGWISSGLISPTYPPGPPGTPHHTSYSVQFTTPGDYDYFCAIHPLMTGEVKVVDSGTTSTQAEIDAAAATQYAAGLTALKDEAAATAASPITVTTNDDGTKLYGVHVSTLNDVAQGDVNQYFPPTVDITEGDSVKWVSNVHTPHTVTFGPPPQSDPLTQSPTIPDDGEYDGTGLANSAVIGVDMPNGTSFQLTFTKAGEYDYLCLLHADQGQVGQVIVAAATPPPSTPTATPPPSTPTAAPTATPPPPSTPTAAPTATTAPTKAPGVPNVGSGSAGGSGFNSLWLLAGAFAVSMALGSTALYAARRR